MTEMVPPVAGAWHGAEEKFKGVYKFVKKLRYRD